MSLGRSGETATVLDDGTVLVAGGVTAGGQFRVSTQTTEIYHPDTDTWTAGPDMTTPRARHTATKLADGRVLIVAGRGGSGLSSAEIYDPATNAFSAVSSTAYYRSEHAAVLLANGKVLVAGGMGTPVVGGAGPNSGNMTPSAELFDPATNTWAATGSLTGTTPGRWSHTATQLNTSSNSTTSGKVLIAGGINGSASVNTAQLYNPSTGTWATAGNLNVARHLHTATLLPNGNVLAAGGMAELIGGSFDGVVAGARYAQQYDMDDGDFSLLDA
jgi:hypothetical protein